MSLKWLDNNWIDIAKADIYLKHQKKSQYCWQLCFKYFMSYLLGSHFKISYLCQSSRWSVLPFHLKHLWNAPTFNFSPTFLRKGLKSPPGQNIFNCPQQFSFCSISRWMMDGRMDGEFQWQMGVVAEPAGQGTHVSPAFPVGVRAGWDGQDENLCGVPLCFRWIGDYGEPPPLCLG